MLVCFAPRWLCAAPVSSSPGWICANLAEEVQSPGLTGEQERAVVGDEPAGGLGAGCLEAGRPGCES